MSKPMTPLQDSLYDGRNVAIGESIEVADRDIKSMLKCGWVYGPLNKPSKKLADDKPAQPKKGKK